MIKKFNQYNESLRDKMTPKKDEDVQIALDKSIIELKRLILKIYDITEDEINTFIKNYYKTIHWSLTHDLKTPYIIYRDFEYLLHNTFGEEKFK